MNAASILSKLVRMWHTEQVGSACDLLDEICTDAINVKVCDSEGKALPPSAWRPIDNGAKGGKGKPVIIAVRVEYQDGTKRWAVGEAYWNADKDAGSVGFWWAGTTPGDYHADVVDVMTGTPELYQPMPEAPAP